MQRWIQAGVFVLLASGCFGQRPARGNPDVGPGVRPGIPAINPIPPLGAVRPMGVNVNPMRIRPVRAASFYSLPFSGGYGYGYAPPNMVVIEQPPSPPPFVILEPPVAPTPVQSVVHEYGPSSAPSSERSASERSAAPPAAPPASLVEPPSFGIVLKDGSVREAAAVTVQDGMVHYVDPNGEHGRVGLEAVDREATKRLNRERKLDLRSL